MSVTTCVLLLLICSVLPVIHGASWEIKNDNRESWVPSKPIFAISLEAYTDAFSSTAYCLQKLDGPLNGLNREMCSKCHDCVWKLREGFTTEEEWMISVKEEMARRHRGTNNGNRKKIATWWIVEAPPRDVRRLDKDFISQLEVSLRLSLSRLITSANRRARYFLVSGTLEEVCLPLQALGFQTCTPRPAILGVHPALSSEFFNRGGVDLPATATMDIEVSLTPQPYTNEDNGQMRANALANAWVSVVATSVGHVNAIVRAESTDLITIQSLTREEAGVAALSIAYMDEVDSILPAPKWTLANRYAASVVQGDASSSKVAPSFRLDPGVPKPNIPSYPLWDMGIHGEGQIIGVADSGLDWNHGFFHDDREKNPAFSSRYVFEWESTTHRKIRQYATTWMADTIPQASNDHGTHVCGTVAGTTGQASDTNKGIAYAAKLAFFDIHNTQSGEIEVSAEMDKHVFPIPYSVGARIHSNSWNNELEPAGVPNEYGPGNRAVDRFTYDNQDFVVLFSASNDGNAPGTVRSPATAKNVIAVGASLNVRQFDSSASPRSKFLADFSSRGPTPDGRIKPDVCASGVDVRSARSLEDGDGHKSSPLVTLSGTSMATPVVAGATALVRQYFMEGYYPDGRKNGADAFTPMGALLKAIIVNSAGRMVGKEATRQGYNVPSMDFGFGLVEIDSTLTTNTSPSARKLYVDGEWTPNCAACPSVNEGDSFDYVVKIAGSPGALPLKITLVWADYPAQLSAPAPLINDLDLTLRNSHGGGVTYSNGGSGLDTKNTVEHITVAAPRPGARYTLTVEGTDVAYGPQPYAIVISGPFEGKVTKIARDIAP